MNNQKNIPQNFQKKLDKILEDMEKNGELGKTLLLHSCCAPCSSYPLEYLRQYFNITVFYYNPNISYEEEYIKRVEEQKRLIKAYNELSIGLPIRVIEGDYEPDKFFDMAKGLENCKEGGERCFRCFELRLRKTAELAKSGKYDYFTTTLTISPLKNAAKLNEIGEMLACEYGIDWLVSDFKKKNGYKRSTELSREYNLYRQDYCGCVYSKTNRTI
jgi:predicted adenine nucleotide alpha hydrolase (AANH) superfamily ATPase